MDCFICKYCFEPNWSGKTSEKQHPYRPNLFPGIHGQNSEDYPIKINSVGTTDLHICEPNLEVKLPTVRPYGQIKSRGGKSQRREEKKKLNSKKKKSKKKNVRKGRKVAKHQRVGCERVRSQLARGEMKNCAPLWREAHVELKTHKKLQLRRTGMDL